MKKKPAKTIGGTLGTIVLIVIIVLLRAYTQTEDGGQALELLVDPSLPDVVGVVRQAMDAVVEGPAAVFGGDKGALWSAWTQASGGAGPGRPARERAACARAIDLWLLHLSEHLRGGHGLPGLPAPAALDREAVPALLHQIDRLQALREALPRNPNVRLALEQTLLELSS